jgi:imidazole glycerol-phosphate synthase subunit HisH
VIAIIDYDMGNVGSIKNMLKKLGVASAITRDPAEVERADSLILPGVGAFDAGMQYLTKYKLDILLQRRVIEDHIPVLGICLGMQLMTMASEEGSCRGLSWVDAECKRFSFSPDSGFRVPHIGWTPVAFSRVPFPEYYAPEDNRFYFVHSYYVRCKREQDVVALANYGQPFVAGFQLDNIVGVQFHPEKSHKFGMALLEAYSRWS